MIMKQSLNDSDGRRQKYLEKNLTHGYFDHHKPHADWPGIRPGSPQQEKFDYLLKPWHDPRYVTLHPETKE
jgi:hypothetical protein